jgi:hypothetical protein
MLDCIKTIAVDKAPQTLAMMFKYAFVWFYILISNNDWLLSGRLRMLSAT